MHINNTYRHNAAVGVNKILGILLIIDSCLVFIDTSELHMTWSLILLVEFTTITTSGILILNRVIGMANNARDIAVCFRISLLFNFVTFCSLAIIAWWFLLLGQANLNYYLCIGIGIIGLVLEVIRIAFVLVTIAATSRIYI